MDYFYGIRCPHCQLAFYAMPEDETTPVPCPRCGIDDPDAEPEMCGVARVLELRDHPNTHESLVREAERLASR